MRQEGYVIYIYLYFAPIISFYYPWIKIYINMLNPGGNIKWIGLYEIIWIFFADRCANDNGLYKLHIWHAHMTGIKVRFSERTGLLLFKKVYSDTHKERGYVFCCLLWCGFFLKKTLILLTLVWREVWIWNEFSVMLMKCGKDIKKESFPPDAPHSEDTT